MTRAKASVVVGTWLGNLSTRPGTMLLMCVGDFLLMSETVLGVAWLIHSAPGIRK
jgi:hypothetical protein